MKVAMLIQRYLPALGGAERQLASLVPLLVSHGVEVHVLTRARDGLASNEQLGGATVHRVGARAGSVATSAGYTAAALRRLREIRPDVLHAHDLLSPTTTAMIAGRALHVPVVVKVLRSGEVGDVARLKTKPFGQRRLRAMRRAVDRFVAISDDILDELEREGIDRSSVELVPNGVDLARFRPVGDQDRSARRVELGLDDVPTAVFTGRLAPEKRVDELVGSWDRVRAVVPDAQLVVVGDGLLAAKLRRDAGRGVHVMGPCDDVSPVLAAADVLVLPSRSEGLSNAMLEAMASGLAVVATDVGGAPDAVVDGVSGRLVPVDPFARFEAAVVEVLSDTETARRWGGEARATVERRYALEQTASRLVELYSSLSAR